MRWTALWVVITASGCPPSGDAPRFDVPDAPDAVRLPDAARPDATVADECIDSDNDGFVAGARCSLRAGDCAPNDGTRHPKGVEICNGLDDDCDMSTDEGDPGADVQCDTGQSGVCGPGITLCRGGMLRCRGNVAPGLETCDGADDDCDGLVDEGDPQGGDDCDTGVPGVCATGVERCREGSVKCEPAAMPEPERCNSVDDDCDGRSDEGFPGEGDVCPTGRAGDCAFGTRRCNAGVVDCEPDDEPEPERCNERDDDCDGSVDETWTDRLGAACRAGDGACAADGRVVCRVDGSDVVCDAEVGEAAPERCNQIDDDCDGDVDEGFDLSVPCNVGVGVCRREGQSICDDESGGVTCQGQPGAPGPEVCNAADDDCDGATDEEVERVGQPCERPQGPCRSVGVWLCPPDGVLACDAPSRVPELERCNGIDDDCDGEIDEDFVGIGEPCDVGVGACARAGEIVCSADGDAAVCSVEAGVPSPEACNRIDDDCDGRIDNRAECPAVPTARVTTYAIASADDPACRNLDGDPEVDNALGNVAELFNPSLLAALRSGTRVPLIRTPDVPAVDGAVSLDLVWALADGVSLEVDPLSVTPTGSAAASIDGIEWRADRLHTPAPRAAVDIMSPFFFVSRPALLPYARVRFNAPAVDGPAIRVADTLAFDGVRLTGTLEREQVLADYRAAAAACAALEPAPSGCAVFGNVPPDVFEAGFIADVDGDGDGVAERVSACLVLSSVAAPDVSMPPIDDRACLVDTDCLVGHICRVMPHDSGAGVVLARRCGVPGTGGALRRASCTFDDDCREGLCVATSSAGPVCAGLCEVDADCNGGDACIGVPVSVLGASTPRGRVAKVCAISPGSGVSCDGRACPGDEVCAIWVDGEFDAANGEIWTSGRCRRRDAGGALDGAVCTSDVDCVYGHPCVDDGTGTRRCLASCAQTEHCPRGSVCRDRVVGDAAAGLIHGFCVAMAVDGGSGAACTGELDCPAGDTCTAQYLQRAGAVDRYCRASDGFATVGQPCVADVDCASAVCAGGLCSGICDGPFECGPRLGCVPDPANVVVTPDGPVSLGGACAPAAAPCEFDTDCNTDPACAGERCVCSFERCRVGCREGATCPGDALCSADGFCEGWCRDDASEPNDDSAHAEAVTLTRDAPVWRAIRALCPGSTIDGFAIESGGLPFSVKVRPVAGDLRAALALDLRDADGVTLGIAEIGTRPGELVIPPAPFTASVADSRRRLATVRGRRFDAALAYDIEISLDGIPCDDESPARDSHWQWSRLLTAPGRAASEAIDGSICPSDVDWYAVRVDNGDHLELELEVLGNDGALPDRDRVGLELRGPDFEPIGGGLRGEIAPGPDGDQLAYDPPAKWCQIEQTETLFPNVCTFEDGFQTEEFCIENEDCQGSTYFIRIHGESALDLARYRLTARIDRLVSVECVKDPWEHNDRVELFSRYLHGLDPAVTGVVDELPRLVAYRPAIIAGAVMCPTDSDNYIAILSPNESLAFELVQHADPQPLRVSLRKVLSDGLPAVGETIHVAGAVTSGRYTVDELRFYMLTVAPGAAEVPSPYTLTMIRESVDGDPDPHCGAPEPLVLDLDGRAIAFGTTAGLRDDDRPAGCTGGEGPDRVYAVEMPAAGVLVATVIATDDDGFDPVVAVQTTCGRPSTEVGCNDDDASGATDLAGPTRRAEVELSVERGVHYVDVDSRTPDTAGAYRLEILWRPGG